MNGSRVPPGRTGRPLAAPQPPGPVTSGLKQPAQLRQHLRLPHRLNVGDGLAVNARGSFVTTHLFPGAPQQACPGHPLVQGQVLGAVHGLRPQRQGSAPAFPLHLQGQAIDAAGFLSYGPNTRSSPKGTWSWRFDSRVSPSAGHQLRGCLAPTGLSPVSPPQLSGHTLWRLARVGLAPTG